MSKITFIIPAYNAAKTIRATIESLASQSVPDAVACIVFDDCSKDETFAVLTELRQRYPFVKAFRNETNQGPGANRNKGIDLTDTEYLSFIDADDTLEKDWVETMLKAADGRDLVVSGHKKVLHSGELLSTHHTAKSRLKTYTGSWPGILPQRQPLSFYKSSFDKSPSSIPPLLHHMTWISQ